MNLLNIKCPNCSSFGAGIESSKDLGRNGYSDEVSIHLIKCQCGSEFVGHYEESRRGHLNSESFNYWGYGFDDELLKSIKVDFQAITLKDWDLIRPNHHSFFRIEKKDV